ncbi:EAL domain-containing protein [Shewanella fodinae]|uniref:EAL domain-containing protein n=1 Tax=Shewanella fodinae TaxID=552357 RepID=UPI00167B970E|nr:EAL domain-containing protein [Shewanella fodinae]MCL2905273.1 EAL domain-containing protein [Shewanella fodinae]
MIWKIIMEEELFLFAPDEPPLDLAMESQSWKVLSVEDDANYQASLAHALHGYAVKSRPIEMLTAPTAAAAAELLANHDDLSVVLLDVVMEDDDAGLRLVDTIRQVLGNSALRIVLLTGQPGMAPFKDVMKRYDIDEYWNKADLSSERLRTVVASNIRTWNAYNELDKARRGLSVLVDASRQLSRITNIDEFCQTMLSEIGQLIGVSRGGIICVRSGDEESAAEYRIVSSAGIFTLAQTDATPLLKQLPEHLQAVLIPLISQAVANKTHHFSGRFSALYFETSREGEHRYVMVVESEKPLTQYHINLLQVFSENINNGFNNIVLCNRLSELAYFDPQLNIPNRAWLARFLDNLPVSERCQSALVALNIKDFAELVLSVDSEFLSGFLRQFYQKLQQRFKAQRVIARITDSCFIVLLNVEDLPTSQVLAALNHFKVMTDNVQLHVEVSVALMNLCELTTISGRELLHMMDSTLLQSQREHLALIRYNPQFRSSILERHQLMQGLNNAIDQGHVLLMFQPKVRLDDGSIVGVEALARWREPDGSYVPPSKFVPVAEMSGLINKLDLYVMQLTVAAIKQLLDAGFPLPVSFNVTSSDLDDLFFMASLDQICQENPQISQWLEIEITESQTMQDYQHVRPLLQNLINKGIGVSIDDFGTGYSSLQHITELSATELKIDKTFVDAMERDKSGEAIVDMVIKLGQRFNYSVIAEGIEKPAQVQKLSALGCEFGQGFWFAKPMELKDLLAYLKNRTKGTDEREI